MTTITELACHLILYSKGFYEITNLIEDLKKIVSKLLNVDIQLVDNTLLFNNLLFSGIEIFNEEDYKIIFRDIYQSLCTINSEELIKILIKRFNKDISECSEPSELILPLSNNPQTVYHHEKTKEQYLQKLR